MLSPYERAALVCVLCACVVAVNDAAAAASRAAASPIPSITCRDADGAAVDWWVLIKHPGGYEYSFLSSADVEWRRGGGAGLEGDIGPLHATLAPLLLPAAAAGGSGGGSKSKRTAAAATLLSWRRQLLRAVFDSVKSPWRKRAAAELGGGNEDSEDDAIAYVLYNDEDPGGAEHWEYAHAKGAVAFDAHGRAVWLQHSIPRWPADPKQRGPGFDAVLRPQSVFAQHAACFTFGGADSGRDGKSSSSSVDALAGLLAAVRPHFHAARLPPAVAAAFPAWARLLAPGGALSASQPQPPPAPTARDAMLETAGGARVRVFAKPPGLNASLTDDIVGPALLPPPSLPLSPLSLPRQQAPQPPKAMLWQTWRRSAGALPSACGTPSAPAALNVAAVLLLDNEGRSGSSNATSGAAWGWRRDHSKWGVTDHDGDGSDGGGGSAAACVCDLNRSEPQQHRGGLCACIQGHRDLHAAFRGAVGTVEPCV